MVASNWYTVGINRLRPKKSISFEKYNFRLWAPKVRLSLIKQANWLTTATEISRSQTRNNVLYIHKAHKIGVILRSVLFKNGHPSTNIWPVKWYLLLFWTKFDGICLQITNVELYFYFFSLQVRFCFLF